MIVELLVGAGLVAVGTATARILMRRREANANDDETDEGPKKAPEKGPKKARGKKPKAKDKRPGPRGLLVGDVLLYADTELWLAGMLELDEEGFVARLFPCPGGGRADWVAQLDETADDLVTLKDTSEVPAGPVPEALPVGGRRLSLEARGTADVHAKGEHLPRTGSRATYTILSDAGGRVLMVVDFPKAPRLALLGDRMGKHMVDLLPGGDLEE